MTGGNRHGYVSFRLLTQRVGYLGELVHGLYVWSVEFDMKCMKSVQFSPFASIFTRSAHQQLMLLSRFALTSLVLLYTQSLVRTVRVLQSAGC